MHSKRRGRQGLLGRGAFWCSKRGCFVFVFAPGTLSLRALSCTPHAQHTTLTRTIRLLPIDPLLRSMLTRLAVIAMILTSLVRLRPTNSLLLLRAPSPSSTRLFSTIAEPFDPLAYHAPPPVLTSSSPSGSYLTVEVVRDEQTLSRKVDELEDDVKSYLHSR